MATHNRRKAGQPLPEATRQAVIRLHQAGELSGNDIAAQVQVSRSKVQEIIKIWEAVQAARNGQGPEATPAVAPVPPWEPLPDGWALTVQPFKDLPPHIEAALRASIQRFGVLMPVVKDQYGRTIDGHQRGRLADELGVPYKTEIRHVASDEEALALAKTLNAERRQLSEEERRAVAFALRQEGHSYRAIGAVTGVSHVQARTDVHKAEVEPRGVKHFTPEPSAETDEGHEDPPVKDLTPAPAPRIRGRDQKSYPARRQARDEWRWPNPLAKITMGLRGLLNDFGSDRPAVEVLEAWPPEVWQRFDEGLGAIEALCQDLRTASRAVRARGPMPAEEPPPCLRT